MITVTWEKQQMSFVVLFIYLPIDLEFYLQYQYM